MRCGRKIIFINKLYHESSSSSPSDDFWVEIKVKFIRVKSGKSGDELMNLEGVILIWRRSKIKSSSPLTEAFYQAICTVRHSISISKENKAIP